MIISLSGYPGSGKTTVGKELAKRLNLKFYSMGDIRGQVAKKHNMTINEFNKLGETEAWTDKETDDKLKELAKEDKVIFDSRTAFHFFSESIKIFLEVNPEIGAVRIISAGHRDDEEIGKTTDDQVKLIIERMDSDDIRYKKYYGIHFRDKSNYDLWLDTSEMAVKDVVETVYNFVKQKLL